MKEEKNIKKVQRGYRLVLKFMLRNDTKGVSYKATKEDVIEKYQSSSKVR